jgi:hypothetical protein
VLRIYSLVSLATIVLAVSGCALDPSSSDEVGTSAAEAPLDGWTVIDVPDAPPGTMMKAAAGVQCPSGWVCIYQNSNLSGGSLATRWPGTFANLTTDTCDTCGTGNWNDQMSSWSNFSGHTYCWYFDAGWLGESHVMANGVNQNVLSRENDKASSLQPEINGVCRQGP